MAGICYTKKEDDRGVSVENTPTRGDRRSAMNGTKQSGLGGILAGIVTGVVIGLVIEGAAAFAGSVHGGAEGALRWAQIAGMLAGVVGVWMVTRRLAKSESPIVYRPGRTRLEMEYEVRDENRRYEQDLAASEGEAHRMPKRGVTGGFLWIGIGMVLSALVPMCVRLPL